MAQHSCWTLVPRITLLPTTGVTSGLPPQAAKDGRVEAVRLLLSRAQSTVDEARRARTRERQGTAARGDEGGPALTAAEGMAVAMNDLLDARVGCVGRAGSCAGSCAPPSILHANPYCQASFFSSLSSLDLSQRHPVTETAGVSSTASASLAVVAISVLCCA